MQSNRSAKPTRFSGFRNISPGFQSRTGIPVGHGGRPHRSTTPVGHPGRPHLTTTPGGHAGRGLPNDPGIPAGPVAASAATSNLP
ncbi:MAG: hypothetical protein A2W35_13625 [Chloroflexi bacterium RBG_16_57_11]|nr:MAG: hypothetical protein A2W35_13625 [Chloroflexi bacterium RBG_16_57_11]